MIKPIAICSLFLGLVLNSMAQLIKPSPASAAFTEKLGMVVKAFQHNYYDVQGELVSSQNNVDLFQSSVSVPGSQKCVIFRFHSTEDSSASWQAIMYEGSNYNEAVRIYKTTCRQVDKAPVSIPGKGNFRFTGKTENPGSTVRFVSSVYTFKTKDELYKHLYAEVELVNPNFDQWEVHINIQSKQVDEEDDDTKDE